MNADISNENLNIFLNRVLNQLINYNTLEVNDMKLLCHLVYKEQMNNKSINPFLTTILGYINQNTKIYVNIPQPYETNPTIILNTFLNQHMKMVLGEGNK